MKLRNLMEDAVAYAIVDLHKSCDFCSCEQCRLDILALALNQLPPRYVVTDLGDTYSRADMLETQKRSISSARCSMPLTCTAASPAQGIN